MAKFVWVLLIIQPLLCRAWRLPRPAAPICGYTLAATPLRTFDEAREHCEAIGASLVEIRSLGDRLDVFRLLNLHRTHLELFWVGARAVSSDDGGTFRWTSDDAEVSDQWGEFEPTDSGLGSPRCGAARVAHAPRHSASKSHLHRTVPIFQGWAGRSCNERLPTLCKYEGDISGCELLLDRMNCGFCAHQTRLSFFEASGVCLTEGGSMLEIGSVEDEVAFRTALVGLGWITQGQAKGHVLYSASHGIFGSQADESAAAWPAEGAFCAVWVANDTAFGEWGEDYTHEEVARDRADLVGFLKSTDAVNFRARNASEPSGQCVKAEENFVLTNLDGGDWWLAGPRLLRYATPCDSPLPFVCKSVDDGQPKGPCQSDCNGKHCEVSACKQHGFYDCRCGVDLRDAEENRLPTTRVESGTSVRLQSSLDVHFLNYGFESTFCATTKVGAHEYTSWHRSEHSGFVAATTNAAARKYDDAVETLFKMFDEYEDIISSSIAGAPSCWDSFRNYMCSTLRPRARYDAEAGTMRTCSVCRNVCTDFVVACSQEDRGAIRDLAMSVLPSDPRDLRVCEELKDDNEYDEHAILRRALETLMFPNCTTDFSDTECTSSNPMACEGASTVPPVAIFRGFPPELIEIVGDGAAIRFTNELSSVGSDGPQLLLSVNAGEAAEPLFLRDESAIIVPPDATLTLSNLRSVLPCETRNAVDRADQYTIIMDVMYHYGSSDEKRSSDRASCKLPFEWIEDFDQQGGIKFKYMGRSEESQGGFWSSAGDATCLLTSSHIDDAPIWPSDGVADGTNNPRFVGANDGIQGRTAGRCSLFGVIDGCFGEYTRDLACGSRVVAGRAFESHHLVEETFLKQEHRAEAPPLNGTRLRVALSVDLVAGFIRSYINAGGRPFKVIDESNIVAVSDSFGEQQVSDKLLREAYLNPEGNFALADEMLVATDCFSTNVLSALAIFPAAISDTNLQLLTGPPGSAMSFMLQVTPRRITVSEGVEPLPTGHLRVRLMHRPARAVTVQLKFGDSRGRIRVEPSSLFFDRDEWQAPQQLQISAVDDDVMQLAGIEELTGTIEMSEPTAWEFGLDSLVHVLVQDNDEAALLATFLQSQIALNLNASKRSLNLNTTKTTIAHSFDRTATFEWVQKGFECKRTRNDTTPRLGTLTLVHGEGLLYDLRLGSDPNGAVNVEIVVDQLNDDDGSMLMLLPTPRFVHFNSTSWNLPRSVTLTLDGAEGVGNSGATKTFHLIHRVDSATPYVSDGALPLDLIAVVPPVTTPRMNETILVAIITTTVLFVCAIAAFSRRKLKRAKIVASIALERKFSALEKVQELSEENQTLCFKLRQASERIDVVMSEGGSAMDAYELQYSDLTFANPMRPLGEGSFGRVYHAVFRGVHEVAVKTMRIGKVTEEVLKKFKSEIIIMAPLKHDNLVRLWGGQVFPSCAPSQLLSLYHVLGATLRCWREGADKLCIVLEFCKCGSLRNFIQRDRRSWKGMRYGLALGVAKGLSHLHHDLQRPLIHRDVKPDNILITGEYAAKLADFGESRAYAADESMTLVGTLAYCAPEVMTGVYTESADAFSFALVLLSLVVGDIDYCARLVRKAGSRTAFVRGWRPQIPVALEVSSPALVKLIRSLWAAEPRERPAMKDVVVEMSAPGIRDIADCDPSTQVSDRQAVKPRRASVLPSTFMEALGCIEKLEAKLEENEDGDLSGMLADVDTVIANFVDLSAGELKAVRAFCCEVVEEKDFLSHPLHIRGAVALLRLVRDPDTCAMDRAVKIRQARLEFESSTKYTQIVEQGLSLQTLPGAAELRDATLQMNQLLGIDEAGDIVVYERWGSIDPSALMERVTLQQYSDWNAYRHEARAMLLDGLSRRAKRVVSITIVIDVSGYSVSQRILFPYLRRWLGGEETKTVPSLHSCTFIVRTSIAASSSYALATRLGLVTKNQANKLSLISGNNPFEHSTSFAQKFTRTNMPVALGGTLLLGKASAPSLGAALPSSHFGADLYSRAPHRMSTAAQTSICLL